jgi:hypothetical protein
MTLTLLRLGLIARCIISLAFVWYLASVPSTSPWWTRAFAMYAMPDGVLALVVAALTLTAGWDKGIAGIAALSGLIRVAAAIAIWRGPGMPYFAVTLVLYVGVLATLIFLLGLLELAEAKTLRREVGRNPLSVVLAIEGLATVSLAIVAFFIEPNPTSMKRVLMAGATLEALALLAVAWRAGPPRSKAVTTSRARLSE